MNENRQKLINLHGSSGAPVGQLLLGEIGVLHTDVEGSALYIETVDGSTSAETLAKFVTEKAIDSKIEQAILSGVSTGLTQLSAATEALSSATVDALNAVNNAIGLPINVDGIEYSGSVKEAVEALDGKVDDIESALTENLTVTINAEATPEAGAFKAYEFKQGNTSIGTINIPKDFLVKSAELKTVETADEPYSGAVVGDKYIDFTINAKDASETAEHLYLPVNDLIDVYTAGNGLNLVNGEFSVKLADDNQSEFLTVDANGLKLSNVDGAHIVAGKDIQYTVNIDGTDVVRTVSDSSTTISDAITNLTKAIVDDEQVIASQLASQDTRIAATESVANSAVQDVAIEGINGVTTTEVDNQITFNFEKAEINCGTWD